MAQGKSRLKPIDPSVLLTATIQHIQTLTKNHLSAGAEKNFLLWILSEENPYRDAYLQATSITKTAELTIKLLEGLISEKEWARVANDVAILNAYLFSEVVSDNLAMGLAIPLSKDKNRLQREQILKIFDDIVQQKLAGEQTSALTLLEPHASMISSISSFQQSLATEELQKIAEAYQKQHSHIKLSELEYSVLPQLALNIEACASAANAMVGQSIAEVVRTYLNARYKAINALIAENNQIIAPEQLVSYGGNAILVAPVIAFIIGSINKEQPVPELSEMIKNQLLIRILEQAAQLVRLLNDFGTQLLIASKAQNEEFFQRIRNIYSQKSKMNAYPTAMEFLSEIAQSKEFLQPLARIRKDIKHGEFNICLHNVKNTPSIINALDVFYQNIGYFSNLYQKIDNNLKNILNGLQNPIIAQIISRFVVFHEKLYAKEFENAEGEYAIPAG